MLCLLIWSATKHLMEYATCLAVMFSAWPMLRLGTPHSNRMDNLCKFRSPLWSFDGAILQFEDEFGSRNHFWKKHQSPVGDNAARYANQVTRSGVANADAILSSTMLSTGARFCIWSAAIWCRRRVEPHVRSHNKKKSLLLFSSESRNLHQHELGELSSNLSRFFCSSTAAAAEKKTRGRNFALSVHAKYYSAGNVYFISFQYQRERRRTK